MKQSLRQDFIRHRIILISLAISAGLLTAFLIFKSRKFTFLELDIKWLIVCGLPILLGLLVGGYIKTFKGFGLELESNLQAPIPLSLVSKVDMTQSPWMKKDTLHMLDQLSETEKNKFNRLRFIYGKQDFYDSIAVLNHFRTLSNLRFVEVADTDGDFLYLLPLWKFKIGNNFDEEKIQQFLQGIKTENLAAEFPDVVSDFVTTNENIVEVYKKITRSTQSKILFPTKETLPILNEQNKMIGTVDRQKVEAKIAEEVVKTFG